MWYNYLNNSARLTWSITKDGKWAPDMKFEFEYTDTEISAARYASMMNCFLLEGGRTYYIYNWY